MNRINSKQNRETCFFLLVFALGLVLRGLNHSEWGLFSPLGILVSLLFTGLIAAWCILIRHRVIQPGIRRYLTAVCLFLILLFLFRGMKYYMVIPETDTARYLWYAYYIPMMFYPACALNAMTYMGKPDDWTQPARTKLLFVIPAALSILVLTNDFHQMAFLFPENGKVWSDRAYSYGPVYALAFGWFLFCVCGTFALMIRRCRIPKSGSPYRWLPVLPAFVGLCYSLAYISGYKHLPIKDMILVLSFLTVLTFELAVRLGYIRSNSHYQEVFRLSQAAAQILDDKLNPQYVSDSFSSYNREDVLTAIREGSCIREDMRMAAEPISGGYIIWREDVGELIRLQKELESVNEYLEDRNMVLVRNYETRIRRKKLEEQNRLYNEMQIQTKDKLEKLDRLLQIFEEAESGRDAENLLPIGVITAYLKRRNNLIFLAEISEGFPVSEFRNCINETVLLLETFGITCVFHTTETKPLTFGEIVNLYDAFETVVEETCMLRPLYFVTVTVEEGRHVLRIRISGMETLPEALAGEFLAEKQEDGDFLLQKGGSV